MKNNRNNLLSFLMLMPIVLSFISAYFKIISLIPVVVVMMFVLVAVLPVSRHYENLWMFVLTAFCSIPVNWLLLEHYDVWRKYLYTGDDSKIMTAVVLILYILLLTSMEEIVFGFLTRFFWRKQYELDI